MHYVYYMHVLYTLYVYTHIYTLFIYIYLILSTIESVVSHIQSFQNGIRYPIHLANKPVFIHLGIFLWKMVINLHTDINVQPINGPLEI